ncbi:galactokinase [Halobacillus andaensis]|uniref:Galactokinase n=1 Tax=Halobacillus andaensis TaxID=1176239 RepID=A0A917EY05_HALAA|nr:galactokinase [Halobacillus andaensis]MBP2005352.1 galactokinase [Halobacillus andaensis]GGF30811.1 galactokinase [Halobacillus andaensis]
MDQLKQAFNQYMEEGGEPQAFFAPGRVNLIGEHTDYNGGHVFPCALSVGTYALARKRNDQKIRLYSMNFPDVGVIEADKENLQYAKEREWSNYPLGVTAIFQKEGYEIDSGFDVAFYGNIPNGAGLSSSASIEVLTAVMLKELFDLKVSMIELIKLTQRAENEFVGVNCGIMDQFSIAAGKRDHAILLNCDTLEYEQTPLKMDGLILVIANTNKRRGLADSKYNERRSECEEALRLLKQELDIETLGDLTNEAFDQYAHLIKDSIVKKRARHAVYENNRTLMAVEKLNDGDIEAFGQLMNESHRSLRDDYEVTGKELDALVEAAWNEGAIGSRMTGAGFGGCTISIVPEDKVETFTDRVSKEYTEKTGLEAEFYVVNVGDGAKPLAERQG